MNRLRKFVERGSYGEGPGRTAYAIDPANLPEPGTGFEWRMVNDFMPGEAVLSEPRLKPIFEQALAHGYSVVARADPER